MRHTCPDGTSTRLVRDPKAPVGVLARHDCPRCGWSKNGEMILRDVTAILNDPAIRAALR